MFLGILSSCSDPSSSDNREPPEPPALSVINPELDYFIGNKVPDDEVYHAFRFSKAMLQKALFAKRYINKYHKILEPAASQAPVFEEEKWIWNYTTAVEDIEYEVRLISDTNTESTEWKLYATFESNMNSFSNELLLFGIIENSGTGSWELQAPIEADNIKGVVNILDAGFTVLNETQKMLRLYVYYGPAENPTIYNFRIDEPEHLVLIDPDTISEIISVYWNTETQAGYIISSGTKRCWNFLFETVECS